MAEELNVKIKADSKSLIAELDKVGIKVDEMSKNNATIKISTNFKEVLGEIASIRSSLSNLTSKNYKINISTNAKNVLGELSTLGNASIKTPKVSNNTKEISEKYKSLKSDVIAAATAADKAWQDGSGFKGAKAQFEAATNELIIFKRALGNLSIGSERGTYAGLARSVSSNGPSYDSLIDKVRDLNKEQAEFNKLTKIPTISSSKTSSVAEIAPKVKVPSMGTVFNGLKTEAVSAANTLDEAFKSGTGIDIARNKLNAALDALVNFKRASGSFSFGAEKNMFASMVPSINQSGQSYGVLLNKINQARTSQEKLNNLINPTKPKTTSSSSKSGSGSGVDKTQSMLDKLSNPANIFANISRMTKGLGSTGEVIGRTLFDLDKMPGVIGEAATAAGTFAAGFAIVGLAVYGVVSAIETVAGWLGTIGQLAWEVVKPGLEYNANVELLTNGLAGALASIGQVGDKQVAFNDALLISDGLVRKLALDALKIGVKPEELTGTFRSIIEPALQSGMNIDQTRQMSSVLTSVGKEMGLNGATLTRDASDIIMGQNAGRTKLGKQLGITDADIAAAKASAGGLFAFLEDRLSGYAESNKNLPNTLAGAWSQFQGYFTQASASITEQFMPAIVMGIHYVSLLLGSIQQVDGKDTFVPSEGMLQFIDALERIGLYLASCIDYLTAYAQSITGTEDPLDAVVNLIEDMIGFVVLASTSMVTFGIGCYKVFSTIADVILAPIAMFESLGHTISACIDYTHAFWDALNGNTEGKNNLLDSANTSMDKAANLAKNGYRNNTNNDLLNGKYTSGGMAGQFKAIMADINASKGGTTKKSSINPNDITSRFPPDDSKQKKQEIKDSQRALKEGLAMLKDNLAAQLDAYKRSLEALDIRYSEHDISLQDYASKQSEITVAESQARIASTNAQLDLVSKTLYTNPDQKDEAIRNLNADLAKYTVALQDATTAQEGVASMMKAYSDHVAEVKDSMNAPNKTGMVETGRQIPTGSTPEEAAAYNASQITGVPLDKLIAVALQESGMQQYQSNGELTTSSDQAHFGAGQIGAGEFQSMLPNGNINDVYDNLLATAMYLKKQYESLTTPDWGMAIAKYNTPNGGNQSYETAVLAHLTEANDISTKLLQSPLMKEKVNVPVVDTGEAVTKAADAMVQQGVTYDQIKCAEFVTQSWDDGLQLTKAINASGQETGNWKTRVPDLVQTAKNLGAYESAGSGYQPSKGDAIVIGKDEHHVAMSTGGLGYVHSSGRDGGSTPADYGNNYQQSWPDVSGYISLNKLTQATGAASSIPALNLPVAKTKEEQAIKKRIEELEKSSDDMMKSYGDMFGDVSSIEKKQAVEAARKSVQLFTSQNRPELASESLKVLDYKQRDLSLSQSQKYVELSLQTINDSATDMMNKIGAGVYSASDAVKKYSDYFSKGNYGFDLKQQIATQEKIRDVAQQNGQLDQYWKAVKAIKESKDALDAIVTNFKKAVTDNADYQNNVTENTYSMTTGQKTESKKQTDSTKYNTLADMDKSRLVDYYKSFDRANTSIEKMKILFNDIFPTEKLIRMNQLLGYLPTILEQVRQSSKQAFEDGLNSFLTDGVNNATSLSEAFNSMIISILKSIQKVFADQLTKDWMNMLFPTKKTNAVDDKSKTTSDNTIFGTANVMEGLTTPKTNITDYNPISSTNNTDFNNTSGNLDTSATQATTVMQSLNTSVSSAMDTIMQGISSALATVSSATSQIGTTANSSTTNSGTSYTFSNADLLHAATGGFISGAGTGTSDSVPSMLSHGEFVVKAASVKKMGLGYLNALNNGDLYNMHIPRAHFATGGIVGETASQTTAKGITSFAKNIGSNVTTNANLNIALVKNQDEAIEHFMRSGPGQKVVVDITRNNKGVVNRLIR